MRGRAKRIASLIAEAQLNPLVIATVPQNIRAALADAGAELIEQCERLDKVEQRLDQLERAGNGKESS